MKTLTPYFQKGIFLSIAFFSFLSIQAQDALLFDEIRLTQAIQEYGLTGQGTIIGVLDRGIDYRHPDFIKADGTSRILAILDLSDDSGANAADNPVGVGTVYTQAEINAALSNNTLLATRDASGHGTVTAGIAAGNGRASNDQVLGIAPEADLVIVKITSEGAPAHNDQAAEAPFSAIDEHLDEAISFINGIAATEGKPVAMIANFGSIQGPMDGSSALSRVIDNNFGDNFPGKAFVCGSSDDGDRDNHAGGSFTQGQTVSLQINKETGTLRMDMWHHEDDVLEIEIVTPTQTFGPYNSPNNNTSVNDFTSEYNLFYQGSEVDFFGSTSPRKELLIDFNGPNGIYTLNIKATSISNGRFDAVLNPSRIFLQEDNKFLSFVEPGYTIWDLGSSKTNICPNAYVLRDRFTNASGGTTINRTGTQNGPGSMWTGSGLGPTQDGRIGIDVAVPGTDNIGAYGPDSYFATFDFNLTQTTPATYGVLGAVSGANPVLTGVIALMFEADPSLTATRIKTILQETARADNFTGEVPNTTWGYGKLDAYAALSEVIRIVNTEEFEASLSAQIKVTPQPFSENVWIERPLSATQKNQVFLFDAQGQQIQSIIWEQGATQLQLSLHQLPAGLYILKGQGQNSIFTKRLVKK